MNAGMKPKVEMFANRLRKRLKWLLPWAAQRGVEAYRLYDRDIPEVRLVVDRYGEDLVVYPYVRSNPTPLDDAHSAEPRETGEAGDDGETDARNANADADADAEVESEELMTVISSLTQTPRERMFVKTRMRQKGKAQYGRLAEARHERVVRERGHKFLVNLSDYLDTGLFLDHRDTRALVERLSAGRRVLNLFGYTGSFSVCAAKGGALSTMTVDMSATYLRWATRNFELNGLNLARHKTLRTDVLLWLRDPESVPSLSGPFDLIVLDPPTFSNSQRMHGTFDVKRDHRWLIDRALSFLSPQGMLLFSSNRRGLRLHEEDFPDVQLKDMTSETLPRDFHDPLIRSCYLLETIPQKPTFRAGRPGVSLSGEPRWAGR
jgi:23S rRNA G2069 N7-methylase RlmK/C1962 C5-methylase RlmI